MQTILLRIKFTEKRQISGKNAQHMSRLDPLCFPRLSDLPDRVCARCFNDDDLRRLIFTIGGPRGCGFCQRRDAPTAPVAEVAEHIQLRMAEHYGRAVDQLPYESAEGGYQGWHTDTADLLFETIGLDLPRDNDARLRAALLFQIDDEVWCEYDWLALDPDDSLIYSWEQFCRIVKSERRFFFHDVGTDESNHPDSRSPLQLLNEVCRLAEARQLIKTEPAGYKLFRARPRDINTRYSTAASLGPPPSALAIQSNRMNPPGIPMFYGAENFKLSIAEIRDSTASVGTFVTLRPIRILDLANLPAVPGFFSSVDRMERLTLAFLRQFASMIIQPVARDDRAHIEYLPTQVFTEYLRDFSFADGRIDGLRYRSSTGQKGSNVVLFAGPDAVEGTVAPERTWMTSAPWLRLSRVRHVS
jgi:hypothetical protein